jgi:transcriptional regulator with XRE-family HTH domain
MAQVMELIEQEREKQGISAEKFANMIGVTTTTYSRQSRGKQGLGMDSFQAYAQYAHKVGNFTLLRALGAYALKLDPEQITINPSE